MRFYNFNSEDELACITPKQLSYLIKLETEHLKGTYDTYELKRNDIGVILISDKFETGVTTGFVGRKLTKNMMALVIPSNEYKGKTKVAYMTEVAGGYPRVVEVGMFHSPDLAVEEFCALYGATTMAELEMKRRKYKENKNSQGEM